MLFTSPVFLYLFLPVLISLYLVTPKVLKNFLLLIASLFFYTWGEVQFAWVFLLSMAGNYLLGLLIDRTRANARWRWLSLALACTANLCLLAYFKYSNFIVENIQSLQVFAGIEPIHLDNVHLPIGISFFTFHAISYLIDVARGTSPVQKNPLDLALYLALFPQLIAGPIIRYHDIADQIHTRRTTFNNFYYGLRRFIFGLAKKLIIANYLGLIADEIFAIPGTEITTPLAWLGALTYTLQLYFDFSAYSCMAIGLGRIFGFYFLENFNYPYIAQSIQDFWRRWHISLSRWFRDYLYIPLGGNRVSAKRTYINLCIVFLLCGLWHGASWNFVVWGLFHGVFLALERAGLDKLLQQLWRPLRHIYTLLLVMVAWIFFRANDMSQAVDFILALAGFGADNNPHHTALFYFNHEFIAVLGIALLFATPLWLKIENWLEKPARAGSGFANIAKRTLTQATGIVWVYIVFLLCLLYINAGTYNPFIYFRF